MSKSRLEKFLYALYSLDSSDLPTPLSRIEELYKCWVTGEEAPTFEPLSRVEKYLMAILGAYDVDELPNPISRVEVLLYKLTIGDDNLDDVEVFLSEHEELLAEIIRNRGAGGNIDIEYVLYTLSTEHNTLYNTAKKPVKSAILKGMTLVNICPKFTDSSWVKNGGGAPSLTKTDDYMILSLSRKGSSIIELRDASMFKQDTVYTFIINVLENTYSRAYFFDFSLNKNQKLQVGINKFTQICNNKSPIIRIGYGGDIDAGSVLKIANIVAIEGDHTSKNIPCFEGMISVEMPVLTTSNEDDTKLTTVTCNEEVELRGIGDIKDELNLLTGKLTRRINENGNILSQEITESIDISVVDQDGNDTKLSTFDDLTRVTVTSEGLIPEAMLEVATKNEEVLSTLSLEMDDISTTQNDL